MWYLYEHYLTNWIALEVARLEKKGRREMMKYQKKMGMIGEMRVIGPPPSRLRRVKEIQEMENRPAESELKQLAQNLWRFDWPTQRTPNRYLPMESHWPFWWKLAKWDLDYWPMEHQKLENPSVQSIANLEMELIGQQHHS